MPRLFDCLEFFGGPGLAAICLLCADFIYEFRFDGVCFVVPLAADVGQDGGELLIIEEAHARHIKPVTLAIDPDGSGAIGVRKYLVEVIQKSGQ